MSRLLEFYRGNGTDTEGRILSELWQWDDEELEAVHDFIQWMFPLPERSRFNPDAPLLSRDDIAAFRGSEELRANLRWSFTRILAFLGLTQAALGLTQAATGEVVAGPNFEARAADVWDRPNHNWLRITRILRCLTLLGLQSDAKALYERLETLYSSRKYPITAETFAYWEQAIESSAEEDTID